MSDNVVEVILPHYIVVDRTSAVSLAVSALQLLCVTCQTTSRRKCYFTRVLAILSGQFITVLGNKAKSPCILIQVPS